jgi:hypothetical protein
MLVTRTVTKDVKKCSECPYFSDHPYECSCDLKSQLSEVVKRYRGYGNLCARDEIDEDCPVNTATRGE